MGKRLYVGNLAYGADEKGLRAAFEKDGRKVESVRIVLDRETGKSRGFAFVEMASEEDARAAIEAMDGALLDGRNLRVSEAEDRRPVRPAPAPEEPGGTFRDPDRRGRGGEAGHRSERRDRKGSRRKWERDDDDEFDGHRRRRRDDDDDDWE
ncbi:MAG: hypothetical protein Fur0037_28540 [Planctomycetota bacterium]